MTFTLLSTQDISEINSTARLYRHARTGARLLSIRNTDENKVFAISFRTPPRSSNGVAHILEHSVLGGSQKYPVRDPFRELATGSLQTFLNAITFPDKTMYPVASQNEKDLYNLADVYMDAVLNPRILEHTFRQEGWHLEPGEPPSGLKFNGVVFNEMKGFVSSPDERLTFDLSPRAVFPDTPYGFNSGGDPLDILELSYADFRDFHRSFYHPSNAYLYFYGDMDEEKRLSFLDGWLEGYERQAVDSQLPLQAAFAAPRRMTYAYDPGGNPEATSYLTITWVLPQTGDPEVMLGCAVLAHLLTATPASPLRKALIESGLGEEMIGVGLDDSLRQMIYSTGMRGIRPENVERVEALVLDTLRRLAGEGLDRETVAASLNTVEFKLRERSTPYTPRGLVILFSAMSAWLHDGDPLAVLAFARPLQAIRARLASGEAYFEDLIRRHLLENPHRATVVLNPDPGENERLAAEERRRLEAIRSAMPSGGPASVARELEELKRAQEAPDSPEALATIPTLQLSDLEKHGRTIPLEVKRADAPRLLFHDIPTNGLLYLDLGFDLHALPAELLPYVGLFGRLLLEMGTQKADYVRLTQRIGRSTGGIRGEVLAAPVRSSDEAALWFFLRGKAMLPQAGELLAILEEVLLSPRFDQRERFRQIVLEEKAQLEAGLISSGHRFLRSRMLAHFHVADRVMEGVSGIEYLFFLRRLAAELDRDWAAVLARLVRLHGLLVNRRSLLVNLTTEAAALPAFQSRLEQTLQALPEAEATLGRLELPLLEGNEGLTIPSQVNFVAKGSSLRAFGFEPNGASLVLINSLNNGWLYEKVRLQGGAYGVWCRVDPASSSFSFYSYRDPNLLATLQQYDGAPHYLESLQLSQAELTKAIIGAVGEIDAHLLPDARGWTSMVRSLTGFSDELLQRRREEVLGTTLADYRRFAQALEQVRTSGRVVVLGSAEAIEQANRETPGLLPAVALL